MTEPLQIAFAGSPIDRADHVRTNPDLLAAAYTPAARLLLLDGYDPVPDPSGGLAWGSLADADPGASRVSLIHLGRCRRSG